MTIFGQCINVLNYKPVCYRYANNDNWLKTMNGYLSAYKLCFEKRNCKGELAKLLNMKLLCLRQTLRYMMRLSQSSGRNIFDGSRLVFNIGVIESRVEVEIGSERSLPF